MSFVRTGFGSNLDNMLNVAAMARFPSSIPPLFMGQSSAHSLNNHSTSTLPSLISTVSAVTSKSSTTGISSTNSTTTMTTTSSSVNLNNNHLANRFAQSSIQIKGKFKLKLIKFKFKKTIN